MNRSEIHTSIYENIKFSFARSSGAGGQNVNKVNTKVHATLNLAEIRGLTEAETAQLRKKLHNDINSEDELCIDVQDERNQFANRETALARIEEKIIASCYIQKKRHKTKPTHASKERRLKSKKIRSFVKKNRSANW